MAVLEHARLGLSQGRSVGIIDVVHQKARKLVDVKPEVTDIPAEFQAEAEAARAALTELVVVIVARSAASGTNIGTFLKSLLSSSSKAKA